MIGLGTMGRNLLLNMADHEFSVIGFDKDATKAASLEQESNNNKNVKGVVTLNEMVQQLKTPRRIMMLVPAGKAVDDVIENLLPLINEGDVIIDGGNSFFEDTLRRIKYLQEKKIHFVGMGVSGGEKGARYGPSIMPGGDIEAWKHLQPILEAIAAKVNNEPCVAYMGKDAAGHYVKMVHNGIEYAIMQLISEVYALLKNGIQLSNKELHEVFKTWNEKELQSFLIEITANIFKQKDELTEYDLIDMILDEAGSKGTGKWTSQEAMNLGIGIPTIDIAVSLRNISAYKTERVTASKLYNTSTTINTNNQQNFIHQCYDALFVATILCYAQGLAMLHKASEEYNLEIPLHDVVKIWRGGCIIRSSLLEKFYTAYQNNNNLSNILLDKNIATLIQSKISSLQKTIIAAAENNIAITGLMSALGYLNAYSTAKMPTNLIQAQRDYFGAHTYQRIDKEGIFHTKWND
ncbi:MAG: NADP-dependent phosphogluconate dehydrogenase [Bacteroidetes bacterium]|nr:NADP-dependent phosphogluconate dehydrogenase [Bacteroidota bacterium]MBS1648336.1 NADP-dependent phosphogluconate dehydrogenase [Bacteroidota bacterium]